MFCGSHLRTAFLTPNKNGTFFVKKKEILLNDAWQFHESILCNMKADCVLQIALIVLNVLKYSLCGKKKFIRGKRELI